MKDSEYIEFCELPPIAIITFESDINVVTYELPGNAGANEIWNAIYSGLMDIRCNTRLQKDR